jgi:hypothetical protein
MVLLADNGSASHKDAIRVNRDNFFISIVLLLGFKIKQSPGVTTPPKSCSQPIWHRATLPNFSANILFFDEISKKKPYNLLFKRVFFIEMIFTPHFFVTLRPK